MPVLQLIGSSVIFLNHSTGPAGQVGPALALFLAWLILVAGGLLFRAVAVRLGLVAGKLALCLALQPLTGLALFLLPSLGMELARLAGGDTRLTGPWLAFAAALVAPAFWLPRDAVVFFLGFWALTVFVAWSEARHGREGRRLAARLQTMQTALAAAEGRQASLERASSGQETLTRLEERARLAQSLHDQLGHTITGSLMQLEAASLVLADDPARAAGLLGRTSDTLRAGLAAIRQSLQAIKPEPASLGQQRLQAQLDEFSARHGLATELVLDGNPAVVPAVVWAATEDNLREALTNLLRHSTAGRFSCRLTVLNRLCKVEFRDDGQVSGLKPVPGMGMEGIETRTRQAGGRLIVDTTRGFSLIMLYDKGGLEDGHTPADC